MSDEQGNIVERGGGCACKEQGWKFREHFFINFPSVPWTFGDYQGSSNTLLEHEDLSINCTNIHLHWVSSLLIGTNIRG